MAQKIVTSAGLALSTIGFGKCQVPGPSSVNILMGVEVS